VAQLRELPVFLTEHIKVVAHARAQTADASIILDN